mgnify:CR=1 FL=1
MKIALPTRQNQIDGHFGHCEYFTVLTVDEDSREITARDEVPSPENCGCKSDIASVLSGMGVTVMLAGNMGDGAVNVLNSAGIEVLRGCSGDVMDVALKWLGGVLEDSGESCHEHDCI